MAETPRSAKPVITYFNIRGRAEVIRLIFEELSIEYEDRRITDAAEWQALKPKLPFGAMPIYEEGDLHIVQSHAMYRHLARKHDLYGRDEAEHILCDIVEEAVAEANEVLWRFFWDPKQQEKMAAFAAGALTTTLDNLQRWFLRGGIDAQFWVGNSLTYADFAAFTYLDEIRAFFPSTLARFSHLRDFRDRIAARPRIAAYIASARYPVCFGYGLHGGKDDPAMSARQPA
jgi:prostaglandin-H2 D-isomerase / glutathione transferase